MDGVRTAVVIWVATLCAPLTGLLVGGPAHACPAAMMVVVFAIYAVLFPAICEHTGLRGWSWRTTKGVGILPVAWFSAWYGMPTVYTWTDTLPFLGASIGAVIASIGLVLGTPLGRSFQKWTWLPAIDADTLIQERFAAACWRRGVEPVDLQRTLYAEGDMFRLAFVEANTAHEDTLDRAKDETHQSVQRFHQGRLWPQNWNETMESSDIADSFRLTLAMQRGEGFLPALETSAHERMAVLARHTQKAI